MQRISFIFHWQICPNTDIIALLKERNYEIFRPRTLEDIEKKHSAFAADKLLPYLPIIPYFTKEKQLIMKSTRNDVWNIQEQYIVYEMGFAFYILSFNTRLSVPKFELLHYFNFHNHSIFGTAIYMKRMTCRSFVENQVDCSICKNINVYHATTVIACNSKDTIYQNLQQQIDNVHSHHTRNREYSIRGHSWRIQKNKQLILVNNNSNLEKSELFNIIKWSYTLVKGTIRYGGAILQQALEKLPPYSRVDKISIRNDITDYLQKFFFRFLYTDPVFITDKEGIRLNIDSPHLNSLSYVYESFNKNEFWEPNKEKVSRYVPDSFVPEVKLYQRIRISPYGQFNTWAKLLNPVYFYLPPFQQFYAVKLSDLELEICYRMAQALVQKPNPSMKPLSVQTKLDKYTVNKITVNLLERKRGRINETVEIEVWKLVDKKILVNDGDEFYLNPQVPYTELFIQLNLYDIDLETVKELQQTEE